MDRIDRSKFEGNWWKPENNVQYVVEFANPRVEAKTFGDSTSPKNVLKLDVISIVKDEPGVPQTIYFHPPKEFNTSSLSFIDNIIPIVDKAISENKNSVCVILRKTGQGKEVSYNINDAGIIQKFRG